MAHELPALPYATTALEPHIDAKTMEIHHGKHHKAYVDNLNKALESDASLGSKSAEELIRDLSAVPESIRMAVRNNGGGHVNHSLFWTLLSPSSSGKPSGKLAEAIASAFGSFEAFQEKFQTAGATRFGSGWAWLVVNQGKLALGSKASRCWLWMFGSMRII
jgi:Fe-Mn family superoxide dismutase